MKYSLILAVPFLIATQLALASGEPASVDCFARGNEISFSTDSTGKDTDNVIEYPSFYANAKEGQKNKHKDSGAQYIGSISDESVKGTRDDDTLTYSYKDEKGNELIVHGDNGKDVKNQDSIYSRRYSATIIVKLKSIDTSGAQGNVTDFPKGRLAATCLYNPGN